MAIRKKTSRSSHDIPIFIPDLSIFVYVCYVTLWLFPWLLALILCCPYWGTPAFASPSFLLWSSQVSYIAPWAPGAQVAVAAWSHEISLTGHILANTEHWQNVSSKYSVAAFKACKAGTQNFFISWVDIRLFTSSGRLSIQIKFKLSLVHNPTMKYHEISTCTWIQYLH